MEKEDEKPLLCSSVAFLRGVIPTVDDTEIQVSQPFSIRLLPEQIPPLGTTSPGTERFGNNSALPLAQYSPL